MWKETDAGALNSNLLTRISCWGNCQTKPVGQPCCPSKDFIGESASLRPVGLAGTEEHHQKECQNRLAKTLMLPTEQGKVPAGMNGPHWYKVLSLPLPPAFLNHWLAILYLNCWRFGARNAPLRESYAGIASSCLNVCRQRVRLGAVVRCEPLSACCRVHKPGCRRCRYQSTNLLPQAAP